MSSPFFGRFDYFGARLLLFDFTLLSSYHHHLDFRVGLWELWFGTTGKKGGGGGKEGKKARQGKNEAHQSRGEKGRKHAGKAKEKAVATMPTTP